MNGRHAWCGRRGHHGLALALTAGSMVLGFAGCGGGGSDGGDGPSILGQVIDSAQQGLAGVTVSAYGGLTTTDGGGHFALQVAAYPQDRIVVSFQKTGYFDSIVNSRVVPGQTPFIKTILKEKINIGAVEPTGGGTLTSGVTQIVFPPDSLVCHDGSPPSGNVNIYINQINVDDVNFGMAVPGNNLVAADIDNFLVVLFVLYICAEDHRGVPVVIKHPENPPVISSRTFPPREDDTGCRTFYQDASGRWVHMDFCSRQGSEPGGRQPLRSFGAFNMSDAVMPAGVSGRILHNGSPVSGTRVRVGQSVTHTGREGRYIVDVPAGQPLSVETDYGSRTLGPLAPRTVATLDFGESGSGSAGIYRGTLTEQVTATATAAGVSQSMTLGPFTVPIEFAVDERGNVSLSQGMAPTDGEIRLVESYERNGDQFTMTWTGTGTIEGIQVSTRTTLTATISRESISGTLSGTCEVNLEGASSVGTLSGTVSAARVSN